MQKSKLDKRIDIGGAADAPASFEFAPKRVALAAVDRREAAEGSSLRTNYEYGFAPFLIDVAKAADAEGCDTLMYAPMSHHVGLMGRLEQRRIFGSTGHLSTIVLESAGADGRPRFEIWRRGQPAPHRFTQRLIKSSDRLERKQALMDGLPARTFGSTVILACGETNIVSTRRDSTEIRDRFGFMPWLAKHQPRLILNPVHTYMVRREMKRKRELYSKGGRTVLSVWNCGYKEREAPHPWTAFANGKDVTAQVREVDFAKTKEIRLGVFDVK